MDVVETLDILIDKIGWAAVLTALVHIARTDGFEQLVDAVQPVCEQIKDPEPNSDGAADYA